MNAKQKKFCREYVKSGNITQSAIKAGYTKKSARQTGSKLLTKDYIKEYIDKLMRPNEEKDIAEINEVLAFFSSVMRNQEKDQFGLDAQLRDRIDAAKELHKRYAKTTEEDKTKKVVIVNDLPRD